MAAARIPTLIDYQNGSYVEGGQKILLFLCQESDFYLTSRRVLSESEKDEKVSIEAQLVIIQSVCIPSPIRLLKIRPKSDLKSGQ